MSVCSLSRARLLCGQTFSPRVVILFTLIMHIRHPVVSCETEVC